MEPIATHPDIDGHLPTSPVAMGIYGMSDEKRWRLLHTGACARYTLLVGDPVPCTLFAVCIPERVATLRQLRSLSQLDPIARIETILALISFALSLVASVYLLVSLFGAHEICYGVSNQAMLCKPLAPTSLEFAQQSARTAFVLSTVIVLFLAATLAAWWQHHTKEPSNRSVACGVLVTCTFLIVAMTVPAMSGAGFYLAPATLLMTIAAVLGLVVLIRDWRASRAAA
jgi:magnesium-transporting ATPase (P-type)